MMAPDGGNGPAGSMWWRQSTFGLLARPRRRGTGAGDEIVRLRDEGKNNREVARDIGVEHHTVAKVTSGEKRKASKTPHPEP
jgi:hypothetical protein